MMLNNRGRVVNDLIVYRFDDPAGTGRNYILECDATELKSLTNTLIRYRMRKKVDMVSCADSLAVFALFRNVSKSILDSANDPAGGTAALPTLQLMKSNHAPIAWTLDPRVPAFGGRVVLGRDQAEMDAYFGGPLPSSIFHRTLTSILQNTKKVRWKSTTQLAISTAYAKAPPTRLRTSRCPWRATATT